MMSEGRVLLRAARQVAVRLTATEALRNGVRAGVVVIAASFLLSASGMIIPVTAIPVLTALLATAAAVALVGIVSALVRSVDPQSAGRWFDLRIRSEERVSTALELILAPTAPGPLGRRVIADAIDHLAAIDLRDAVPVRFPKETSWMAVLAVLLLVWTTWVSGLTIPGTPARRTAETIRQEGSRLEQFATTLQSKARTEHIPLTRRAAPAIRDLGVRLQQERIDRAQALARIAELSRQIGQTRREISERIEATRPAPSGQTSLPQELLQRQALQRQIRQLQELTSRLRQDPSGTRKDALERLGAITQQGEGNQPAQVQRNLQRARDQLQQGNVPGAGESLTEALRELEGLQSLLADAEGLKNAQQQLDRSRTSMAGGPTQADTEATPQSSQRGRTLNAPGRNPPSPDAGNETAPPQGPNEGTTPGTGEVRDKIGASTPRLQVQKAPSKVRGSQAEGPVTTSEVIGTGRPGESRVQSATVSPTIVTQADRAMERARTPARYRTLVRRYFELLARFR